MPEQQPATSAPIKDLTDLIGTVGGTPARPSHPNVAQTTFDDETISSSDFQAYKGRKNHTDRIGILMPRSVVFGRTHFVEEKGFLLCSTVFTRQGDQDVPTRRGPCCERLDPPRHRFVVPIIQYTTNPDGQLMKPFSYSLKVWRFTEQIFVSLRNIQGEYPLGEHDVQVLCTDDQYQRLTITPCREAIYQREEFKTQHGPAVQTWLSIIIPKLDKLIGRRVDPREWSEILGVTAARPVVNDAPAVSDIADLLGA